MVTEYRQLEFGERAVIWGIPKSVYREQEFAPRQHAEEKGFKDSQGGWRRLLQ